MINTRIIMVSFFVLAFILVIGSSTITHYVKQNTSITSVKGFTSMSVNSSFTDTSILYNGSLSPASTPQSVAQPSIYKYNYLIGSAQNTNGCGYTDSVNIYYYNSVNVLTELETSLPSSICDGTLNWANYTFQTSAYQKNTSFAYYENTGGYATLDFISTNLSLINFTEISGSIYYPSSKYVFITLQKGQNLLYVGNSNPSFPSSLKCFDMPVRSGFGAFCTDTITGAINISTGNTLGNFVFLVQKPQTYNFNSIFSYQSLEGQLPSCVFSYGYKPNLTINGNQISVYSAQNITQNVYTNFTSYYNLNFSLTGISYVSANLLANVNSNLKILNSNFTILDLSSGLEFQNAFYSDLNTSTENKNLTFNFSSLNEKLINTFLGIGTYPGTYKTQIQAKNTNSSEYYPIKLNLTITMPITNYNREIYIKNVNFTINNIGQAIYSNATKQIFDIANLKDIYTIQNKNYTETNDSINSFTINYSYNNYAYIHNSNSANYGNYVQIYIPITIYYFVNTTEYPYAFANFTSAFNVFVNNLTYMYSNGDFSFSTLDSVPFHAIFNSSNSEIVNPSGSEIYNETYTNSSFVPYMYFSFTKYGNVPIQLELLVNNIDQSSSAKFEINGKNYTTSGSILNLNLNSSTIYENNYAYFTFNNIQKKVPFTFETISFNPCLLDQPIVLYKIKDNISANGSITAISTCYNGICNVPQNITNSSTTSTSSSSGFSLKGTKTFFGMSYISIGALSFILTNQFLYMVFMLFVLLILAKKYKHDKMLPYVVFGLFTLIGFGLGLVNDYIFAMFMLVLVVAIANSFKRFLPIST